LIKSDEVRTNFPTEKQFPGTQMPKRLKQIRTRTFLQFEVRLYVGVTRMVYKDLNTVQRKSHGDNKLKSVTGNPDVEGIYINWKSCFPILLSSSMRHGISFATHLAIQKSFSHPSDSFNTSSSLAG